MSDFPSWIPQDVKEYLAEQPNPSLLARTPGAETEEEAEFLKRLAMSPAMRSAWNAILRRKDKAPPVRALVCALYVYRQGNSMDQFPSPEQIEGLYKLSENTKALAKEVALKARRLIGEDWHYENGYPLKIFFKVPPYQALCELADYFELSAEDWEQERTNLTAYVGKPGATEAKRVYVIRLMAEQIRKLFDQPLYNTVSLFCGEILDEPVDSELVRKLVKTGDKLERPYWSF